MCFSKGIEPTYASKLASEDYELSSFLCRMKNLNRYRVESS